MSDVSYFCKSLDIFVSGAKWQYAARAAVMTMMGSFGGGCFGLIFTLVKNKGRADVMELINGILGSLVSVTGEKPTFKFNTKIVKSAVESDWPGYAAPGVLCMVQLLLQSWGHSCNPRQYNKFLS
ncbi:hypothetical protein JYU34_001170 [Plutella xylostella]|uniref:Ammonium transporter AmtB-like domain-containing protein n=1 Tax=Plutella xylostella TaxID=51655 RepID=A0ABQ7R661_PLUXY|nr:hypothetical protein JYU34_001170 [Plutella xylostella]